MGQVFGEAGADLGIAQLRAGLAKCESQATKDQVAAQREAQKAGRGLWQTTGGSHWWHFSVAVADGKFPEPKPLKPETDSTMFETIGLCIEILVALVILGWIVAYFGSTYLSTSAAGKTARQAARKPANQADEPFVNLFQMKWGRTKQSTFPPPDFTRPLVGWVYYS